MYIDRIRLNNFRPYKGEVVLDFAVNKEQNVSVISGNNGYGKTSLLTSLLWCLYGKLIIDVDEPYRKEVYDAGGYKNYCRKLMNHSAADENKAKIEELKQKLFFSNKHEEKDILQQIEEHSSFSVTIQFSKIFIPAFPCDFLEVKRIYNIENDKENLYIYIDGRENELTKQVGPEIFINDFILRKEIAKFFFFDSEKIVALAE
jgi:DNA sulfur modification protein DndD